MRYRKGSIALSETRDCPLIRQVLHSGFVTHRQLYEFLKLDYCVSSRNAFNNRVLRLVKHGLLNRCERQLASREAVYYASLSGAMQSQSSGDPFVHSSVNDRSNDRHKLLNHSLELNDIHLALKRTGSLVYWMPETEVRARNDLTSFGYWKYYDAVLVVRLAGQHFRFALEYERTLKAARHYVAIRERIEQEPSIAHFLYLVPNHEFVSSIAEKFSHCRRPVYIGLFREFLDHTLTARVRRCGSPVTLTLSSVLATEKEPQRPGILFPGIAV
jgi:hypothetical protein